MSAHTSTGSNIYGEKTATIRVNNQKHKGTGKTTSEAIAAAQASVNASRSES